MEKIKRPEIKDFKDPIIYGLSLEGYIDDLEKENESLLKSLKIINEQGDKIMINFLKDSDFGMNDIVISKDLLLFEVVNVLGTLNHVLKGKTTDYADRNGLDMNSCDFKEQMSKVTIADLG